MSIALRVTRGYSNGTLSGSVHDIVYRGYSNGVVTSSGGITLGDSIIAGTAGIEVSGINATGGVTLSDSILAGLATKAVLSTGSIVSGPHVVSGACTVLRLHTATGGVVLGNSIIKGAQEDASIRFSFEPFKGNYLEIDKLNALFQEINYILEYELVYRDLETPLRSKVNMNGFRFINVKEGTEEGEAITLGKAKELLGAIEIKADSYERQTGADAVNDLTTLTKTTYTPGDNEISIYMNGVKQVSGIDYYEDSSYSVYWPGVIAEEDVFDIFTSRAAL